VAWIFGVLGAVLVYWASRRYGRRFFEGRVGRRLISPGTFAAVEREYLRFGVGGIFFFRLLPAFRSFVAPFAGLVNLGPVRTLVPITLACAVWYAGLVLLGGAVGSEWDAINQVLGRLNRGLAVLAVLVLGGLIIWLVHRRKVARRERLAELRPFDPANPDQPVAMEGGLPQLSVEDLDQARRERRRNDEAGD